MPHEIRTVTDLVETLLDRGTRALETVHQVRKRCKKVRGLLRLVRPRFGTTYQALAEEELPVG